METVFRYIGEFVFACLVFAVAVAIVVWATSKLDQIIDKWRWRVQEEWRREIGRSIRREAYWFSEDPATMRALEIIGRQMSDQGGLDIAKAREEWRAYREQLSG